MVGKTKAPTVRDAARMDFLKNHSPCLPCLLFTRKPRLPSIQHVVKGNRRLGHKQSYSLCEWHHFGMRHQFHSKTRMVGMLGPSITHGRKIYEGYFGTEENLVRLQNMIYDAFQECPWLYYNVPGSVLNEVINEWVLTK